MNCIIFGSLKLVWPHHCIKTPSPKPGKWAGQYNYPTLCYYQYWKNKANIRFLIFAEFMILYCTDSLGCIDNNNIELINIYLYHFVTVITTCFMFHQRLLRCPHQCIKEGKPTSLFSLRLATLANIIYDVGVLTSGEPVLVVLTVGVVVVSNSVVCIWCTI